MTAQTEDTIDILLATFNGAAFLDEQLDSIAAQTHRDWRLIARDDGSTDRTPDILDAFRTRHPDKVVVVADGDGNLGFVQNFSRLMAHSDAPYAAYCDQDDVWIPEKLELSLAKMRELERKHGAEVPLLVFTDLTVVDGELKVINSSFWRYQGLRPRMCNLLSRLILQNVVTGATALMSRALVQKAGPIPARAHAHDWWVALVAAAFGATAYISQPGVLYRQHGGNIFGARRAHIFNIVARCHRLGEGFGRKKKYFAEVFEQAEAFQEHYAGPQLETHGKNLATFLRLPNQSLVGRIICATKCDCWPNGILGKIVFALASRGQ